MTTPNHVDVLIVGAGLSGIGAAHHLQERCPQKSVILLEARDAIGGTWDLFRYPGIRSDSDMYTFGYRFRPWTGDQTLADGPSILRYIRETAEEAGIDQKIRFGHRVVRAEWSSELEQWTVWARWGDREELVRFTASFVFNCSGYYRYDRGYTPEFPHLEAFKGQVVHPQHWPEALDYADKRVVVIGSGATAVTLVPAMAEAAKHVVMLQRSPTYVGTVPSRDAIAMFLRRWLPAGLVMKGCRLPNRSVPDASCAGGLPARRRQARGSGPPSGRHCGRPECRWQACRPERRPASARSTAANPCPSMTWIRQARQVRAGRYAPLACREDVPRHRHRQ